MNRSPGTRRKAKAPPPPPPPPPSTSQPIENEEIDHEGSSSDQYLTGNQSIDDPEKTGRKIFTSKSVEENSSQSNQLKNIYKRFTKGFFLCFLRSLLYSVVGHVRCVSHC